MPRIPRPSVPDRSTVGPRLRQVAGLALVFKGLVGGVLPRHTIAVETRLLLGGLLRDPGDVEPTDTAVGVYRDASLAVLVFGALVARRGSRDRSIAAARRTLAGGDGKESGEE